MARGTRAAGARLGRLLAIVPYVVGRRGAPVEEICSTFDITRDELLRDLNLLLVTGSPPYTPDVLIDFAIDDDEVTIALADALARPLTLTRVEAVTLYLRGAALAAGMGDEAPIRSALDKLADAYGDGTLRALAAAVDAAPSRAPDALADLRSAAEARERIRFEYHAASTGETSRRTVEPEQVFLDGGNWYVAAWDLGRDAERLFRADRVAEVERTGDTFAARGLEGAGRALYSPDAGDVEVRLRLRPAARWVAEYYAFASTEQEGDSLLLTFPAGRLEWVERLLLRLGADAEVLEPADLRERVRSLASRALVRYRGPT